MFNSPKRHTLRQQETSLQVERSLKAKVKRILRRLIDVGFSLLKIVPAS